MPSEVRSNGGVSDIVVDTYMLCEKCRCELLWDKMVPRRIVCLQVRQAVERQRLPRTWPNSRTFRSSRSVLPRAWLVIMKQPKCKPSRRWRPHALHCFMFTVCCRMLFTKCSFVSLLIATHSVDGWQFCRCSYLCVTLVTWILLLTHPLLHAFH